MSCTQEVSFIANPGMQRQLLPTTMAFAGAFTASQRSDAASAKPSWQRHPFFVITALLGRGPVCST
ncbi:MAG: hypothetical protein VX665_09555 [Pseudomonadota bacterium]|nr:hypothetical protein [Pseudomonadota bacterium]